MNLCVGTRPGLELSAFAFAVFVKGEIGKGLIGYELLLFGVAGGEIKVGVPGAGVEVDLVLYFEGLALRIKRDDLVMVCVSVENVTGSLILESRLFQRMFGEGALAI